MTIAILSTLISSIALVGVAVSLIIQSRQLRASQLQASRAMQADLIKIGMDTPVVIAEVLGQPDAETYVKASFVNLSLKSLELSYSLKAVSAASVRIQALRLFTAEFTRSWWEQVRSIYKDEASSKREREFFELVDRSFTESKADDLDQIV